jgi:pimeloyl-ACP methyl ester carboxylesterase
VIDLDLSGHGDSGRRSAYGPRVFASDMQSVIHDPGLGPVILVAHSMGGLEATVAVAREPAAVSGLVLLDTIFRPVSRPRSTPWPIRSVPTYPTLGHATARSNLLPRQPDLSADVLDPVASYAVKAVDDGWSWKFDLAARPPMRKTS